MKIKKVKYNGDVKVVYFKKATSGESETLTMESFDEPRLEFQTALQEMRQYVPDLIAVPRAWGESIVVLGVTISYSDGKAFGFCISCKKRISGTEVVFVLNTPHMTFEDRPVFAGLPDFMDAIRTLQAEAVKYINGQRAQQKLPFEVSPAEIAAARISNLNKEHGVTVTATVH